MRLVPISCYPLTMRESLRFVEIDGAFDIRVTQTHLVESIKLLEEYKDIFMRNFDDQITRKKQQKTKHKKDLSLW